MFKTLHRLYVTAWILLLLAGGAWLYFRLGLSEQALDWYAVWRNKSDRRVEPVAEVTGQVVRVLDGVSFSMRGQDRQLYNVALIGLMPPSGKDTATNSAQGAKARLSELILSNDVRVAFTYVDPQRRGTGLAHLGGTNVNAAMVESGLVPFKPEFVKTLPLTAQYALLRADRKARQAQRADRELSADR